MIEKATQEIKRLENLGWQDWPISKSGLRYLSVVEEDKISFPSEVFQDDGISTENQIGFWEMYRAKQIFHFLNLNGIETLWEIGAGNGSAAIPLRNMGINLICVEPLKSGANTLSREGFVTYWSTLEQLKLPNSSIEAIGIFDVLEHLETPDDILKEIYRVLKPNGYLITTVPAHNWLFSDFDSSIGHFRRYSKKTLEKLLTRSSFIDNKIGYFLSILVVPALILRTVPYKLGRKRDFKKIHTGSKKHLELVHFLNFILGALFLVEKLLPFPFGLSIISVSKKPFDN